MAKKTGGLGRGLGSLFGDLDIGVLDAAEISVKEEADGAEKKRGGAKKAASSGKTAATGESVVFIKLSDIKPNSAQPRRVFQKEALEELAASIREHGVIQPVLLRPSESAGYELVAGERRWRAARLAGLKKIPAIVRELNEQQNMFYALTENMQREDLNSIEEALGMEEMMRAFGLTQEETARAMGKSRSYVANALRLLRLPQEVQDMVMDGRLSAGHARAIAGLAEEALQKEAAAKAVEHGWSVRQIESYTGERKSPAKRRKARRSGKNKDRALADVEQRIGEILGTKVRINGTERKGRLELEYYSRGELERLIEILAAQEGGTL